MASVSRREPFADLLADASGGDGRAALLLGLAFSSGGHGLPKDTAKAAAFFAQAAEHAAR